MGLSCVKPSVKLFPVFKLSHASSVFPPIPWLASQLAGLSLVHPYLLLLMAPHWPSRNNPMPFVSYSSLHYFIYLHVFVYPFIYSLFYRTGSMHGKRTFKSNIFWIKIQLFLVNIHVITSNSAKRILQVWSLKKCVDLFLF